MATIGFVASCIMDLTFEVDSFPKPGETVMTDQFHTGFGGKGANQAVAAAKTGADVQVIGAVGQDGFGNETIKNFEDHGIDAEFIFQLENSGTGLASISVDQDGENLINVAPRANLELNSDRIDDIPDDWFDIEYISGVNEFDEELLLKCFIRAKKNDADVVLNAAPARTLSDEMWEVVDCFIVNENEAKFYLNDKRVGGDYKEIAKQLLQRGPERVIMTLGSRGSLLLDESGFFQKPTQSVETVDTTGAGDAFVGSYLSARSRGLAPPHALEEANRYSAKTVESKGTQKSFPYET